MVTTIRRHGAFAGILTALLGLCFALPFTLLHPAVPYMVLLIGFGVVMALRRPLRLPQYPTAYLLGCLVALVLLLPAVTVIKFAEQGFDDGPFYGVPYTNGLTGLTPSDRLPYRAGELLIYNRNPDMPPILAYETAGTVRWAQELEIQAHPGFEQYQLDAIAEPTLAYGIVRDRIDSTATWSFGTERCRIYLWKWGRFHRFYLSW
ncbi:MAG: hypothetical protein IGR92_15740 [Leptolyngbyaceae cyanobacterium T60_A2020_046]|nr:hypothetical protein [Leptolyngbyaceae cyanobacterium T60_A2020_046]